MEADCNEVHSSLRSRRTQMGTLGLINLVLSSSSAPAPLASRRVPPVLGRRTELCCPPSPLPSPPSPPPDLPSDESGASWDESGGEVPPPPSAAVARHRAAQRPRRAGRARTGSQAEHERALVGVISAALRRMLGMRTAARAAVNDGMAAKVVGSSTSAARFLFCVVGTHAIDLAAQWFSPDGAVMCSCWGHTENVALLSMAGESSTCWHADAFRSALGTLLEHKAAIVNALQVAEGATSYAIDIAMPCGTTAAAFDGDIYSPVVATRRRDIKCVSGGCRSNLRRCQHAALVRKLPRLVSGRNGDDGESDTSADDDGELPEHEAESDDETDDDDELVAISKERQKRNLISCREEDKQGLLWCRTAEWANESVAPTAFVVDSGDGNADQSVPQLSTVQRMAKLGLTYDPANVLHEKSCGVCGAVKTDGQQLETCPALLYTDGHATTPLQVC